MERIEDDEEVYRRILHYHFVESEGRVVASAFMRKKKLDPEVSVFRARLTDPRDVLDDGLPQQKLVALKVEVPRKHSLEVLQRPNERFPGHCIITGFGENWKEQCARLAEASRLVSVD